MVGGSGGDLSALRVLDGDGELASIFAEGNGAEEILVLKPADDDRVAAVGDFSGGENTVVSRDLVGVFDDVVFRPRAAAERLRVGEFFTGKEVCVIDDVNLGEPNGEGVWIDRGKVEGEVGLLDAKSEMENLGGAIASVGCFDNTESAASSQDVVDFERLPASRESFALFPIAFVDGNAGVGEGGRAGGEIDAVISSVGEIVGDLEQLVFDRDQVAFLGNGDGLGGDGGDHQGKKDEQLHWRMLDRRFLCGKARLKGGRGREAEDFAGGGMGEGEIGGVEFELA